MSQYVVRFWIYACRYYIYDFIVCKDKTCSRNNTFNIAAVTCTCVKHNKITCKKGN